MEICDDIWASMGVCMVACGNTWQHGKRGSQGGVAKLKQLSKLHMRDTQITDAGVAELKKALPKCKIFGP